MNIEATWSTYQAGQVMCIGDEVYVDPKGAICVSLATDSDTLEIVGLTHRLNLAEWTSFKAISLTNDLQEASNVFTSAIPDPLSASSSENQEHFQTMGCTGDSVNSKMSCLVWQPNEVPELGASQKFPRFSAGNGAMFAWTDASATQNISKMKTTKLILAGATNTLVTIATTIACVTLLNF